MSIEALSAWREPLADDWGDRLAAVLADPSAANLRHLPRWARMRLGDGERLRLRRAARKLRQGAAALEGFRVFRLLLVSNRTLSFFAGDLEASGVARGLLIEAVETGYDQVNALALNPGAPVPAGRWDAVLLMLDANFFPIESDLLDREGERLAFDALRTRLGALTRGLGERIGARVILATAPTPPESQFASADASMAGTRARLVGAFNQVVAELAGIGDALPFDLAALAAKIGTFVFFDPARFHQAKIPFSFEASPVVADGLSALISAMTGKSGRALALDLDNTLWGGVVADDGLEGIALGQGSPLGETFLEIQRHALDLKTRGVALAVCSKNLEDVALSPFRSHPDMLLRESDIAVFVANFTDKATNLAAIARELDLDPSSLVFLDDNPAERERVRSALPGVMVPELGDDPAYFTRDLVASGYLEYLPLTADDRGRADAYKARADAKALRSEIGDYDEYLRSLRMEMTIAPFDALGRARITQLIQKSNQFNLTTTRYNEIDIARFERDPRWMGMQVRLKDRFADHGMISVVIVERRPETWRIDTWVMSCRVLERGVERAVMSELARMASAEGAVALEGLYKPTARNALVADFYPRLGFAETRTAAAPDQGYRLDIATHSFAPVFIDVVAAPPEAFAKSGQE